MPGLGLLGLKAAADSAKFKASMGMAKLGMKGAKKAFHAGALLGAANPNEFDGDDGTGFVWKTLFYVNTFLILVFSFTLVTNVRS